MKKLIIAWGYILLLVLMGCGSDKNNSLLATAEACMETQADSVRILLQQMHPVMTKSQQARYALLWTQATHKCGIPLRSDSLINVAVEYFAKSGDRHLLAKSWLYKGLVHKEANQIELATEAFVASEEAFEEVEDNQYKALLYNHFASLLAKQYLFEDALSYYKKTYRLELLGDSVHYLVYSCSQIAKMYEMLGEQDSAEVYYRRGFFHAGLTSHETPRYALLQNYAVFLMEQGEHQKAEEMLKEVETHADSTYIYNVCSALSTLYCETGRYEEALFYGRKMLESHDSVMQCSGFLHLYKIYKRMGDMEKAVCCHERYRWYDSDLTLRRKSVQVASLPHKMRVVQLEEENRTAHHWLWIWGIGVLIISTSSVFVVRFLRKMHRAQMDEKNTQLDEKMQELDKKGQTISEKESLLDKIKQDMFDLRMELGRVKGSMSNQSKIILSLKEDQKNDKAFYDDSVKMLKRKIHEMEEQRKVESENFQNECEELRKQSEVFQKEQKQWKEKANSLCGQIGQYELLQRFLLDGGNMRSVLLLLELKSGKTHPRVVVHRAEYAELLKQLVEYRHPGLRQLIETDEVLKSKQELACLVSLGFYNDMDMLCQATNLKQNSVRTYCSQVKKSLAQYGFYGCYMLVANCLTNAMN